MLGGDNTGFFLDENCLRYPANPTNQLQLFGNIPAGCKVDPVNYIGMEHDSSMFRPSKRVRDAEVIPRQQKLQISLNHNNCHDETDRHMSFPKQNPVSTGLRLSYDDDEHNSSISSLSGSMTTGPSMLLSLGDNFRTELDRQEKEFDLYIKTQGDNLVRGIRDINQRHMASFLTAVEKNISKKLQEKDLQIENINRKNRELAERIKHMANEAQNWHYRAKYNESVVNILQTNLQQALSAGPDRMREGFGDSEIDDTASCVGGPNNYLGIAAGPSASKDNVMCRSCKVKEVSFLVMPCRHLCLCKDCEGLVSVCPVCQLGKASTVQVFLS